VKLPMADPKKIRDSTDPKFYQGAYAICPHRFVRLPFPATDIFDLFAIACVPTKFVRCWYRPSRACRRG
jgi:hypothetical protein